MQQPTRPITTSGIARGARGASFDGIPTLRSASEFAAGARGRISDYVYEELSEAIRSLRLEPGAPLSEPAVAEWLGVSRAPVREAFTRLVEQRFVLVQPQVGSRVAPISMRDVADAVFIRTALETAALRQAVESGELDTGELQRVVTANREAAANGDAEEFFETDEQLHELVFALAGLPHMWRFVRGTKMHLDRLRRLSLPFTLAEPAVCDEHQRIVDALVARDASAGAAVVHEHAHRVIDDSIRIRREYPDYFSTTDDAG